MYCNSTISNIKKKFNYAKTHKVHHIIDPKVYNLVVVGTIIILCHHHHFVSLEHFYHPRRNLFPVTQSLPLLMASDNFYTGPCL